MKSFVRIDADQLVVPQRPRDDVQTIELVLSHRGLLYTEWPAAEWKTCLLFQMICIKFCQMLQDCNGLFTHADQASKEKNSNREL